MTVPGIYQQSPLVIHIIIAILLSAMIGFLAYAALRNAEPENTFPLTGHIILRVTIYTAFLAALSTTTVLDAINNKL